MSFGISNRLRAPAVPPSSAPTSAAKASATSAPTGHSPVDSFQPAKAAPADNTWSGDRPLSEARNAHRTNTKEEFQAALDSGANWFEGDVRKEINRDTPEMRHDKGHEDGDNLTLNEWLTMGKASGRGLKLDIKEGDQVLAVLDEIEKVGIREDRLMLNLSFGDMAKYGAEIRQRFPNAILAINPPTDGDVKAADAARMVEQAKQFGGPVTFVVNHEKLTDEALQTFLPAGPVSVWGESKDPMKTAEALRERGVNGVVDIAGPHGTNWSDVANKAKNWVKDAWDSIF